MLVLLSRPVSKFHTSYYIGPSVTDVKMKQKKNYFFGPLPVLHIAYFMLKKM